MKAIIEGRLYDTETATLVAGDDVWGGRNKFLYRTKRGRWFLCHYTQWQGEHNRIEPIGVCRAQQSYEDLTCHEITYKQAFGIEPEEA